MAFTSANDYTGPPIVRSSIALHLDFILLNEALVGHKAETPHGVLGIGGTSKLQERQQENRRERGRDREREREEKKR